MKNIKSVNKVVLTLVLCLATLITGLTLINTNSKSANILNADTAETTFPVLDFDDVTTDWMTLYMNISESNKVIVDDENYYPNITSVKFTNSKSDISGTKISDFSASSGIDMYVNGTKVIFYFNGTIYAPEDSSYMFAGLSLLEELDLSNFNMSKVTIADSMFNNCYNIKKLILPNQMPTTEDVELYLMIPLINYSTNQVVATITSDMAGLTLEHLKDGSFFDYNGLNNIAQQVGRDMMNLKSFEFRKGLLSEYTKEVHNDGIYYYYVANENKLVFASEQKIYAPTDSTGLSGGLPLTTIDLSNLYTDYTYIMDNMFAGSAVTELDLSKFNMSNVQSTTDMLANCTSLKCIIAPKTMGSATIDLTSTGAGTYCEQGTSNSYTQIDSSNAGKTLTINGEMLYITEAYLTTNLNFYIVKALRSLNSLNATAVKKIHFIKGTPSGTFDTEFNLGQATQNENVILEYDGSISNPSTEPELLSTVKGYFNKTSGELTIASSATIYAPTNCFALFAWKVFYSGVGQNAYELTNCEEIIFDNFVVKNVTDMSGMFFGCKSLKAIDVSNFDSSKCTDFSDMFNGCSSLTTLDVLKLNTSKGKHFGRMFNGCSSLITLDLSGFNTSSIKDLTNEGYYGGYEKGTSLKELITGCSSLLVLDISSFNLSSLKKSESLGDILLNCNNLRTIYAPKEMGSVTTSLSRSKNDSTYFYEENYGANGTKYTQLDSKTNGKALTINGESVVYCEKTSGVTAVRNEKSLLSAQDAKAKYAEQTGKMMDVLYKDIVEISGSSTTFRLTIDVASFNPNTEEVVLMHYKDNKWVAETCSFVSFEEGYLTLDCTTSSFSSFALLRTARQKVVDETPSTGVVQNYVLSAICTLVIALVLAQVVVSKKRKIY